MPVYDPLKILLTVLAALAAATPLAADDPPPPSETKLVIDFERGSHVVRREEDRFNFRYRFDKWDIEGLLATLTPRFFRDGSDQAGVLVSRAFGSSELTAVARLTDRPSGEDAVGSVSYRTVGGLSAYGVELTFGQADLADDFFLVPDGEDQFVGRAFWRRGSGFEVSVFASSTGTFDLRRNVDRGGTITGELLERLPRSEIAGAETLADLYVDEERLEDSAGASVGFGRGPWRAVVYAKSGEQTLRGFTEGDDFTGFGGEVEVETDTLRLRAELDLRQLDTVDDFSFGRGRVLADFEHRSGRLTWGAGGYVQGEAEHFGEIPDLYDTAGFGATASWRLRSGKEIGLWAMSEDNAPDFQTVSRVGFFRRSGEREYGVGLRRDENGRGQFSEDEIGPFVFGRLDVGDLTLDGDVGVQDGEVYGRLSIGFRR